MYRNKKNKKNKRNIFSIAVSIGLTIIFACVGVRIFGMTEKESKENNKSFFAFAELDEHMAGLKGQNKEAGEKIFEDKTKETGQEIFTDAGQETFGDKAVEAGQETSEVKTEEPQQQALEEKTEKPQQETFTDTVNEVTQEVSEDKTEEIEQKTFEEKTGETEQETSEIPENEINTENQGSMILNTEYAFTQAPEGYFEDALFIGDSRTVGLEEYGNLEGADFFAAVGMSVYNLTEQKADTAGEKNINIETLLSNHSYGKIYFMLGLNELGYNRQKTVDRYRAWVEYIRQMQPQAILFIEANLHVTAEKSKSDEESRNEDIDEFNNYIKELADNKNIFYVDVNEIFDNKEGCLRPDLTFDGVHILAKYYGDWGDWLREKAVIR